MRKELPHYRAFLILSGVLTLITFALVYALNKWSVRPDKLLRTYFGIDYYNVFSIYDTLYIVLSLILVGLMAFNLFCFSNRIILKWVFILVNLFTYIMLESIKFITW
jgi:hypothetical protein